MANNDVITKVVEDVAGQDVLPLIEVLKGKKNISEFTIAEELKEEINTIRNKLYRLYDSNLVEFIRKKDKKKGWYIYYWTFIPSRIPFLFKSIKSKKIDKLKERVKSEQGVNFFECPGKCLRMTFDKAIDLEFKCPECGDLMNQEDNAGKIEHMLKEIGKLEKEIENLPKITIETPKIEIEKVLKQDRLKNKINIVQKPMKVKSVLKKNTKKKYLLLKHPWTLFFKFGYKIMWFEYSFLCYYSCYQCRVYFFKSIIQYCDFFWWF